MRTLMLGIISTAMTTLPLAAASAQAVPEAVPAPVAAPAEAAKPAAVPQKTAEQASADRENEMICKRERETGSLVKTKKTCHTRSQWAYIKSENQRMGQDMILNNQGKPPGGN